MNIFSLSNLFVAGSSLILILFLLIYGKSILHRIWTLFNLAVFIWGVGTFIAANASDPQLALLGWQIALAGGVFTATFFFHTVCIFCESRRKRSLAFAYFVPVVTSVLFYLKKAIPLDDWHYLFNQIYYYRASPVYLLIMGGWAIIVSFGFYELLKYLKKSKGVKRTQALYFCFGSLVGFVGGVTVHLPSLGIPIYPIGNFGVALYAITVTYAILRYRLLDIRVFISRTVAFIVSYIVLLGTPFFFAYRMYPVLYPLLGIHWWLVPSGMLVFFASVAPPIYGHLRNRMEERLLAEQKRYQKLLLQAASGMAIEHDLSRLSKLIVYIVKRTVKIEFAAIFIDDKKNRIFRLKAARNTKELPYKAVNFLYEHPFIEYLKQHKDPLLYEELPLPIRETLAALSGTNLIIPSLIQDKVLGFVLLGEKLNHQPYTDDDMNVFKILSHQAALAIENCLFLEESKEIQERIFTAEKLASIGGMADGVAHQIKNRLNQFSVASGEIKYEIKDFLSKHPQAAAKNKDLKKTLDYLTQIADSFVKNVKRTDGIVRGILNFARVEEKETFFSHFSLKEVIDLATELLKVKHEVVEVPLKVKLDSSDVIYGVKSQITESIYNLLDNAFEATQEKRVILRKEGKDDYQPAITLKLLQKPICHYIEISDNGIGIRDEQGGKIFAPFFTTKSSSKSGTGIGMYVVRRMVEENHKGRISFTSSYMEGTKFSIELPRK